MPMPLWWGQINKRIFNPTALKNDKWAVISHTGRSSGKEYRTPIEAHSVEGGYVFILIYGPESDWVQNIFASGSAALEIGGETLRLQSPRLIPPDTVWEILPAGTKRPASFLKVTDFLRMDLAVPE